MMSRKHYQKVADIVSGELSVQRDNPSAQIAVKAMAYSLADMFAQDNPRFDRGKFYHAAGMR